MAFTNLAVFGGAFFTPIVVGKITHTIGWWWTFYLVSIFCAACLFAIFFFCPETAFRRDAALNTDTVAFEGPEQQHEPTGPEKRQPPTHQVMSGANRSKKTYWQSLAPFDGRKTDENFFKLLFRPFPLFVQPAFLWACLIQGAMIGWTVFIGVVLAAIFLGPPLFWDEVSTGYAYVGPFLGALLGFLIAGALSDWSAKFLTKRNGGVYEPEFRILLVIPQLLFGCMGLYGFAVTSVGTLNGDYHWTVPIMFFGFEVCGMVIGAVASSLYIVDAYRKLLDSPVYRCPSNLADCLCSQEIWPSRASLA
jgi:MFS family permease